jgi:hypothetical protein
MHTQPACGGTHLHDQGSWVPIKKASEVCFFEKKVTAQVWRSPPRKASGKASGSFLKKRTKKL